MTFLVPKSPSPIAATSSISVEEMEALLSDWFGGHVVLTSSGRSALLLVLEELGFSRYVHRVALPRLISKCVLEAAICSAFPVDVAEHTTADATLRYHQYGFLQLTRPQGVVIDDIAQAFFSIADKGAPRAITIFSLPKFFPTTTMVGGVILADADLARRIRVRRDVAPAKSADVLAKESATFIQGTDLALLYTARLLNPRIDSSELGGLPTTHAELEEIRRKRGEVMETLLEAAPHLVPPGWASMLRENLPYAFPVSAPRDVLERLNRELQKVGVESDIYHIDVNRDMMHPKYEEMLLVPYSHLVPEPALHDMVSILSSK